MRFSEEAWLYIVRSGEYFIKIGIAGDVDKRIKALQIGNPELLQLWAAFKSTRSFVKELEEYMHEELESWKVHGEWFELEDEPIEILRDIVEVNKEFISDVRIHKNE